MNSTITLKIELDENKIPENIKWSAPDGGVDHEETKAFLLSIWDHQQKETLKIDLWTKDMPVDEMKLFFHQIFVTMSETYMKATDDDKMAKTMRDFADYFSEKLELYK